VGLKIPVGLPFESWAQAGVKIARIANASAWHLGDWLVFGQSEYVDRYQFAVEAVGLDYQTLRNYAWVARSFDLDRRRPDLSFQHHAEVASLPPDAQDVWLARAAEFRWSKTNLRKQIRDARGDRQVTETARTLPKLNINPERITRWRKAAERSSTEFELWITAALDAAAARDLQG
jgi:hypothetical protein